MFRIMEVILHWGQGTPKRKVNILITKSISTNWWKARVRAQNMPFNSKTTSSSLRRRGQVVGHMKPAQKLEQHMPDLEPSLEMGDINIKQVGYAVKSWPTSEDALMESWTKLGTQLCTFSKCIPSSITWTVDSWRVPFHFPLFLFFGQYNVSHFLVWEQRDSAFPHHHFRIFVQLTLKFWVFPPIFFTFWWTLAMQQLASNLTCSSEKWKLCADWPNKCPN